MGKDDHSFAPTAIAIERDGERHIGSYIIEGSFITVRYEGSFKSTPIGSSPPDSVARLLLAEIVSTYRHLRAIRKP
jgi:hypothetical protein